MESEIPEGGVIVKQCSRQNFVRACASKVVREAPFIAEILLVMGVPIKTPVDAWIDNALQELSS